MSFKVTGHAIVDGTAYHFGEAVAFSDRIFDVVDSKLADLAPLFTRADRRVIDAFNKIDGCSADTSVNLEAFIRRGIYLELPSGIHFQARVFAA